MLVKNDVTLHFAYKLAKVPGAPNTNMGASNAADHYTKAIASNDYHPLSETFIDSLGERDARIMPEVLKDVCSRIEC